MKNYTINLYVSKDMCPKCAILRNTLIENNIFSEQDVQTITVNPFDTLNTDNQFLIEKGMEDLPVLVVDNDIFNFSDSMKWVEKYKEDREKEKSTLTLYGDCANIIDYSDDSFVYLELDAPKIKKALEKNSGYCPCKIKISEDTKCICKEFREQKESGICHCGLYYKEIKNKTV